MNIKWIRSRIRSRKALLIFRVLSIILLLLLLFYVAVYGQHAVYFFVALI